MTLKLNVSTVAKKQRTRKQSIAPNYTLAPAPSTVDAIEAALTRLINPPALVCASNRTVGTVDWTVALYSDDTVRIVTDAAPVALGRFVTSTAPAEFPGAIAIDARIIDVLPVDAVSADVLQSLTNDLTYFAMRAGRFSGKVA
jgi:hypothetical protein